MVGRLFWVLFLLGAMLSAGCGPHVRTRVLDTPETRDLAGHQRPYMVNGKRYDPLRDHSGFVEQGTASWYGPKFHGRKTSNGETFDMYALTAAHKTLPLGVSVRVTNLRNGRQVVVRVNDRGPFVAGRIIDLSYAAAKELDMIEAG
ncbi:MAG: septal ring lytic transglycosylase RlpA family protein, partial [Deltaproteobacteria bacterium]